MTGVKESVAFVLIVFGITAELPDFVGGMALGIGTCSLVFLISHPKSRGSFWLALAVGFVTSMIAAIMHPYLRWISWLPLQAVMAIAGALSMPIAESTIAFGTGLKKWAATLPEKIPFGGGGGGNDAG